MVTLRQILGLRSDPKRSVWHRLGAVLFGAGALLCFAGVAVRLGGTNASLAEARALAAILNGKDVTSAALLTAAVARSGGWKLEKPVGKDDDYTFGHRTILAFVKKGGMDATVHVLDYSRAASGKDDSAVNVSMRRVLIVSAGSSASPGRSAVLMSKLLAP